MRPFGGLLTDLAQGSMPLDAGEIVGGTQCDRRRVTSCGLCRKRPHDGEHRGERDGGCVFHDYLPLSGFTPGLQ